MFPEYRRGISSYSPDKTDMQIVMSRHKLLGLTTGIINPVIHFKDNMLYITFDYYNNCFMQHTRNSCTLRDVPIDLETLPEKVEIRNRLLTKPVVRSISKIFQK